MLSLQCPECSHSFQIEESRLPSSTFKVKCPGCRQVFQATTNPPAPRPTAAATPTPAPVETPPSSPSMSWEQVQSEVDRLVRLQLDMLKEDLIKTMPNGTSTNRHRSSTSPVPGDFGDKKALVCEPNSAAAQQIVSVLQRLGYGTQICTSASESLNRLDQGFYHVITSEIAFPDDGHGGHKILERINTRKPDERRKVFVAVISESVKTLGPQGAFFQGANVILQKQESRNLETFLQEGMKYFDDLYRNYNDILEETQDRL